MPVDFPVANLNRLTVTMKARPERPQTAQAPETSKKRSKTFSFYFWSDSYWPRSTRQDTNWATL
jgi:hypothetical protein